MTTDNERRVTDAVPKDLLINGQWRAAKHGRRFAVIDPSTEGVSRHTWIRRTYGDMGCHHRVPHN
jgi:hypothetical protein